MRSDLERITRIRPAWNKRSDDPKKDYGIHCADIFMVLKGPKGAIHFIFSTGMFLKGDRKKDISDLFPMGVDVGYHDTKPHFDSQEVVWPTKMTKKDPDMKDPGVNATSEERMAYLSNVEFVKIGDKAPDCEWLGVPCYSDGSALRADTWLDVLLNEGSDKIWEMMEAEYASTFEEGPDTDV